MGWQCAVQMLQLVRGDGMRRDGKGQSKHKANAAAVVNEAFLIADPEDGHSIPYRKSASETYDRTRTIHNKYEGISTADGVMEALEEEADNHKIEVHTIDKKTGEPVIRYKGLQSNTPLGVAVIFNPPGAVTRDWTPEQYGKFIADCEDCLAQIPVMKLDKKGQIKKDKDGNPVDVPHYIFRRENRIARAEHWDESEPGDPPVYSPNWHNVYLPVDQDGKYYGSMIDGLFFSEILNKMFPKLMRERGWDIDDTKHTDWSKFHDNEGYRTEAKARIKKGGRSVNRYRADKKLEEAEAMLEEAEAMVGQAAAIVEESQRKDRESDAKILTAEAEKNRLLLEASVAESARDKALAERADAITQKDQAVEAARLASEEKRQAKSDSNAAFQEQQRLQMGNRLLDDMQSSARKQLSALEKRRDDAKAEAQRLQTEITASRKERDSLKSEVAAAEADRDKATAEAEELRRSKVQKAEEAAAAERARIMAEIGKEAERKCAEAEEAAEKAAEARRKEITDEITKDARVELQSLQDKIKELRAQISEATNTAAGIITAAKEEAKRVIDSAQTTASNIRKAAAAMAKGEYAFLLDHFDRQPFIYKTGPNAGKSFLAVAREVHQAQIRNERLKDMPSSVKDAGKGQQAEVDVLTGPRM